MSNNQLAKPFKCFDCKNEVKLQRNESDTGWLKYNMDGSEHNCSQKKKFSKQSQDVAELKTLLQQVLKRMDNLETMLKERA